MDENTGLIRSVMIDGNSIDLKQEFLWYASKKPGMIQRSNGSGLKSNSRPSKSSGAYLFRPNQTDPFPLTKSEVVTVSIYKGNLNKMILI